MFNATYNINYDLILLPTLSYTQKPNRLEK